MNKDQLTKIAHAMVAPGKGILAADESSSTIKKRFDAIGVESTEENRRDYREFMFRADAMRDRISGVILFDETIRQKAKDGTPLVKLIEQAGSIPGIKVDAGAKPMPMFPGETITEGLDGLPKRMKEYYDLGARFAKWRAVITIADGKPTGGSVRANMAALARYAAICQEADIVPIVEPEVLMDGAHSIERNFEVTRFVLQTLYQELFEHRVFLEGSILKPNMVVPGEDAAKKATPEEVAAWTIRAVPRERARGCARHRLPLRWPVRRGGDRQPRRHRQAWAAALGHHLLLRPRPPGGGAEGVVGAQGQGSSRPGRLHTSRDDERPRRDRHLVRGEREGGGLRSQAWRCRSQCNACGGETFALWKDQGVFMSLPRLSAALLIAATILAPLSAAQASGADGSAGTGWNGARRTVHVHHVRHHMKKARRTAH